MDKNIKKTKVVRRDLGVTKKINKICNNVYAGEKFIKTIIPGQELTIDFPRKISIRNEQYRPTEHHDPCKAWRN